jgi:hypothetical protein
MSRGEGGDQPHTHTKKKNKGPAPLEKAKLEIPLTALLACATWKERAHNEPFHSFGIAESIFLDELHNLLVLLRGETPTEQPQHQHQTPS